MYLNVFETHCQRMMRMVKMMRMCECGCVNARTNFEAQRLTILTCETCQHAHCRYVKVRRSEEVRNEEVRKWRSEEVRKCASVRMWECENVRMRRCENVRMWEAALKQNIGTGPMHFTFGNYKKSMKDAIERNIFGKRCGCRLKKLRWPVLAGGVFMISLWNCESVSVWDCERVRVWECEIARLWERESVRVWECENVR